MRRGFGSVEGGDVSIEAAAIAPQRVVVDEAVANIEIEELVKGPMQRINSRWCVLSRKGQRRHHAERKRECQAHAFHYSSPSIG